MSSKFTRVTRVLLAGVALSLMVACASTKAAKHTRTVEQDHFAEIEAPDLPLEMNDRVQTWIDYFQGRGREHFERYLRRSGRYVPMIRRVLQEKGLPKDLVYLAMIESGFNPHAYSRARATGTWQFIYRTGLRYGLQVDQWVDERRDPEKSTVAAAKYLKDLYDRYQNWYLAAAGYNAGEGKIDRAIRKYATEDFWELSKGKYLKAETKNYVPKLIAAAMIARNPAEYGFKGISYEEPVGFEEVTLNRPMDLRAAAKCADISYEEIKALNPELLHWVTPPSVSSYQLKLPVGTREKFAANLDSLADHERMGNEVVDVEEGTTLRRLAKSHGVPVELLAAANQLSTDTALPEGTSVTIPFDPPEGERFYEKSYERKRRGGGGGGKAIVYRVKSGDHLEKIARKNGVSVAALKKANPDVNWSRLKAGEKLHLQVGSTSKRSKVKAANKSKSSQVAMSEEKGSKKATKKSQRSKKTTKKTQKQPPAAAPTPPPSAPPTREASTWVPQSPGM